MTFGKPSCFAGSRIPSKQSVSDFRAGSNHRLPPPRFCRTARILRPDATSPLFSSSLHVRSPQYSPPSFCRAIPKAGQNVANFEAIQTKLDRSQGMAETMRSILPHSGGLSPLSVEHKPNRSALSPEKTGARSAARTAAVRRTAQESTRGAVAQSGVRAENPLRPAAAGGDLATGSAAAPGGIAMAETCTRSVRASSAPIAELLHLPLLSQSWSPEEDRELQRALARHADSKLSPLQWYLLVAACLPSKTARDVAIRCRWRNKAREQHKRKLGSPQAASPRKKRSTGSPRAAAVDAAHDEAVKEEDRLLFESTENSALGVAAHNEAVKEEDRLLAQGLGESPPEKAEGGVGGSGGGEGAGWGDGGAWGNGGVRGDGDAGVGASGAPPSEFLSPTSVLTAMASPPVAMQSLPSPLLSSAVPWSVPVEQEAWLAHSTVLIEKIKEALRLQKLHDSSHLLQQLKRNLVLSVESLPSFPGISTKMPPLPLLRFPEEFWLRERVLHPDFLSPVPLHAVRLSPSTRQFAAQSTNLQYLLSLDAHRLLWSFRRTAGEEEAIGKPYGGWENPKSELRGHFVGHYLSASALAWASTGNTTLKARMDYMVSELDTCQQRIGSGYLSAFPEEFFDRVEAIKPVWAPYYTVHKIMAGLLDQYQLASNHAALRMLTWMVEYFRGRVQRVIERHTVARHWLSLNEEFGGMNDLLYRLYAITRDPNHLELAHLFDKPCFLGPLAVGADDLPGLHANTHIPIAIGAQMRYEATGDSLYQHLSHHFLSLVNTSHSFTSGGTSAFEFWQEPHRSGHILAQEDQESCTTYNMLKMARNSFRWTRSVRFMDYYERAMMNGVMGIQRGTQPGVMIYMLPHGAGNSKARGYHGWGTPFDSFWCCYGTGKFLRVRREWREGDVISLNISFTLRVERIQGETQPFKCDPLENLGEISLHTSLMLQVDCIRGKPSSVHLLKIQTISLTSPLPPSRIQHS
ncbi:unnamed protein product [Closterium sp. Yama58-4]|nr:unnamed protein product [Closterium sp. Yama58-4]